MRAKSSMIERVCRHCGATFRRSPAQMVSPGSGTYCSRACQKATFRITRPCLNCGKPVEILRSEAEKYGRGLYCSLSCRSQQTQFGEANPVWKRGYSPNRTGYLRSGLKASKNIFLHRLVAEQMLGRPLLASEVVHHRDGDKTNNAPENLEVMSRSDHLRLHHRLRRMERGGN